MKQGDLVVIRLPGNGPALGIIERRVSHRVVKTRGARIRQYDCIFAQGKQLVRDTLPLSRFVRVQLLRGAPPFTNLCEIDLNDIEGVTVEDQSKLRKWILTEW